MSIGRLGVTAPNRICFAILMLVLSMPVGVFAQSQGRTNTNTANAVLHIRINVVQTVLTATPQPKPAESSSINYIIPMVETQDQTIVSEAVVAPSQNASCTGPNCSAVLRTTTIVAY